MKRIHYFMLFLIVPITLLMSSTGCSQNGNIPKKQTEGTLLKEGQESTMAEASTLSSEETLQKTEEVKEIYTGPLKIVDVRAETETVRKYERYEISFSIEGFAGNCFDPEQIDVYAEFTSPSGKVMKMPAFWYQDYKRELVPLDSEGNGFNDGNQSLDSFELQGQEKLEKIGEPCWKVRFSPIEKGDWKYTVHVKAPGDREDSVEGVFTAEDSDSPGFIRVEPVKKRRFIFDDGSPYVPIGENVAWWVSPTRGSYDYDVWYKKLADNGANFARVWMGSWSFGLLWNDTGLEDYTNRLDRAYLLDKMLELAEDEGIYIMLTFINHGAYSAVTNPQWQENPFNKANGGYLEKPSEFFTNEQAKAQFKKLMRYIVARWGYSTHIMSWELFNEVSWTDDYDPEVSNAWHKEMADYLKSIDPYSHLVSSSSAKAYDPLEKLRELDFINIHDYGIAKFAMNIPPKQKDMAEMYDKPAFFCEMGISADPTHTKRLDPKGVHIHQGLWAGVMGGGAGTGMTWWWDSYVDPLNLYGYFKPVSLYVKRVPWNDHSLENVDDMNLDISDFNIGACGYKNEKSAYLWLYDKNYLHINSESSLFEKSTIKLNLKAGSYRIEWMDTYTGEIISTSTKNAGESGILIEIPPWEKDIALIVEPQ